MAKLQAVPVRLTHEDYADLPDDGRRYEILEGELDVNPAPGTQHQSISLNLVLVVGPQVRERQLGRVFYAPIDVILADDTIVQPDLAFISAARSAIISERGIEGPPDLLVEILSPATARKDRGAKLQLYARFGVREYWILDPVARTLQVYRLAGQRYGEPQRFAAESVYRVEMLGGLEVRLTELWR